MSNSILVTGAAGGSQGSTGNRVARLLIERSAPIDDPRAVEQWSSPEALAAIRATIASMSRPRSA